jgi:hypothetical protein
MSIPPEVLAKIQTAKDALTRAGIPRKGRAYILANDPPGPASDRLGCIFAHERDFISRLAELKWNEYGSDYMYSTVVDGRDLAAIRAIIGGQDWNYEVEQEWVLEMEHKLAPKPPVTR